MKRVVAAVAAIAMVAASFAVRSAIDDDESDDVDRSIFDEAFPRLICDPELASVCRDVGERLDLAVVVEDLSSTVQRLSAATADDAAAANDLWVTARPVATIVVEARQRAGLLPILGEPEGTLAFADVAVVSWAARAERLPCPDAVTWACVVPLTGRPWSESGGEVTWGDLKPGHPSPDASASGLIALGELAIGLAGRHDLSAADLDEPAFAAGLRQVLRAAPGFRRTAADLADVMAVQGPAVVDVASMPRPVADRAVEVSRSRFGGLVASYDPDGAGTVFEVVVVPVTPEVEAPRQIRDALTEALSSAGWTAGGVNDDGLPTPGVLEALRRRWREITR